MKYSIIFLFAFPSKKRLLFAKLISCSPELFSCPSHNLKSRTLMDKPKVFIPTCFVTGGQSGADSIPFTIHKKHGIEIKGFMPKDFRREGNNGKEIATLYNLTEGEGGYAWRDKKNVELSDALIAFLVDRPKTGKGTMQTANKFKTDQYKYVQVDKPANKGHLLFQGTTSLKPVLFFWDLSEENLASNSEFLKDFLNRFKPKNLMVAGSCESTVPGLELLGAKLFDTCFSL